MTVSRPILNNFDNRLIHRKTTEVDRDQFKSPAPPIPPFCPHDPVSCNNCWQGYPQSRFPNWTYAQVARSKIQRAITEYNLDEPCIIYRVDVDSRGFFSNVDPIFAEHGKDSEVWRTLVNEKVNFLFVFKNFLIRSRDSCPTAFA